MVGTAYRIRMGKQARSTRGSECPNQHEDTDEFRQWQ